MIAARGLSTTARLTFTRHETGESGQLAGAAIAFDVGHFSQQQRGGGLSDVVLAHDRRRAIHFNVTAHPTAEWTAQQIAEAFPWESAPRYLLRDRDAVYGESFRRRVLEMGIREVLTAPRSPWQNPYVERLMGSIRRECLDHVIVVNESSLRRILSRISITTSGRGHIWHWRKMRQNPERFNHQNWGR